MKSNLRYLIAAALALALFPATLPAAADSGNSGALYTMDNSTNGNRVLAFHRAANGALTPAGVFPTGGYGTGGGLGNQGAVVLSRVAGRLFVCNPASHDVSVFAVRREGLELTDRISSGGQRPISLTV